MFETMQSFLLFFIPMLIIIITGIIFEEKLIQFEIRIKKAIIKYFNGKSERGYQK